MADNYLFEGLSCHARANSTVMITKAISMEGCIESLHEGFKRDLPQVCSPQFADCPT